MIHFAPENSGLVSGYINSVRLQKDELWIQQYAE